ncbi:MAG: (Fe-S)-binding protein [Fimbriimonadaceae bacterium]|nr:(Fe-S)-binding protein [Fimbriimonadaceae bacterium]
MRVSLMLTCLCDAFYGEVGIATARILEHCGCTVEFPKGQTCCGQPPFNSGDWDTARPIARRTLGTFDKGLPIIVPSGSCTAMLRSGYPMLGLEAPRAFELSEFLIDHLGIDRWPLRGSCVTRKQKVAFHRSCHMRELSASGRGLGVSPKRSTGVPPVVAGIHDRDGHGTHGRDAHATESPQERLLTLIPGLELVQFAQQEQCCGFGGAFSATHGTLSAGIGMEKLRCLMDAGVDTVVSGDMGCLMHLQGLIDKERLPLKTKHYAQLLAEVLPV